MAARALLWQQSRQSFGGVTKNALGSTSRRTLATASESSALSESQEAATDGKPLAAYMLLSRLPVVLAKPTPLESAYFAYNAKIQRALAQPFSRDLYFKKGSAAETQFLDEERERTETMARWGTDERSASVATVQGGTEGTAARTTESDKKKDVQSLDRSLDRTLFLVVRGGTTGSSRWSLPRTEMKASSSAALHKAAQTNVHTLLGDDMDIWTVTNMPVGLIGREGAKADERGYVMRAHIVAGSPAPKSKGVEYAWFTSEELEKEVSESLWTDLKDLLSK